MLPLADAKKRVEKLREVIDYHRYLYHVLDRQEISEAALDALKHELYLIEEAYPELITPDSPTQRVGGAPLNGFQKITHQERMFSMEDVFSRQEFEAWVTRISKHLNGTTPTFFCMPKVDGLAVSLVYEDGLFVYGATRGDGFVGEDVTHNLRTISSIPLRLAKPVQGRCEVRGEVLLTQEAFDDLNRREEAAGREKFANPRNAAAGSIRQLDPSVAKDRALSFFAWNIVTPWVASHTEAWELLPRLGFRVVPEAMQARDTEAVEAVFSRLFDRRDRLGFWIDGLVVRVNEHRLFEELGVVGKTPRGLVAWKFPALETTAVIREIEWNVGRTGVLTPVAVFDPVEIAGTTVTHASLHNLDEIQRLDVRVGDTVIVYKAGDIIPKVARVLTDLRPEATTSVRSPRVCPACRTALVRDEENVAIVCPNLVCPPQQIERVIHALRAFEIDGIGPQTIQALLTTHKISGAPDLFRLRVEDFLELPGFAEVSATKAVAAIEARRSVSFARFLLALGLPHVGEETARDLARAFGTVEAFLMTTEEALLAIDGIGAIVAATLVEPQLRKRTMHEVEAYLKAGVTIKATEESRPPGPLTGRAFVFTGTLSSMGRKEAEARVAALGGEILSDVTRKATDVVVGEEAGSKREKAAKLGIRLLSEAEFLPMIGE